MLEILSGQFNQLRLVYAQQCFCFTLIMSKTGNFFFLWLKTGMNSAICLQEIVWIVIELWLAGDHFRTAWLLQILAYFWFVSFPIDKVSLMTGFLGREASGFWGISIFDTRLVSCTASRSNLFVTGISTCYIFCFAWSSRSTVMLTCACVATVISGDSSLGFSGLWRDWFINRMHCGYVSALALNVRSDKMLS